MSLRPPKLRQHVTEFAVRPWHKLGRVFVPDGSVPWMHSHAANPFGVWLATGKMRVFFSSRDAEQRSHVASLVLDLRDGVRVSDISRQPLITPGDIGTFDDCGCSMGCAIQVDGQLWLYYLGWNLRRPSPWLNAVGLAIGTLDGDGFKKVAPAPVLDRSLHDPYSLSYPSVLREDNQWRMWYGSSLGWGDGPYDMRYAIKSARSIDGVHWQANGAIVLDLLPGETAIARPQVVGLPAGGYGMWFCHRGDVGTSDYRIGYAESVDGEAWMRRDDIVGPSISAHGWDDELACYPFVFAYAGREYMLYNGNGYGRTGFGLAVRGFHPSDATL